MTRAQVITEYPPLESQPAFEICEVYSGKSFTCREGETVLCAAQRAGIGLSYECSVGGCGSCKVELVQGYLKDLRPDAPGIRDRERAKGKRLSCQAVPMSDCRIQFREDETYRPTIRPSMFEAEFVSTHPVTHDIMEFRFHTGVEQTFVPGQYAMLHLPGLEHHRPYSMSNIPEAPGEWHFMVRYVQGGGGSEFLFRRLRPGDRVTIDGPYSTAYLRPEIDRDVVLIGGGSGLAPMVSILRGIAADPTLAHRKVIFLFGGRKPRDICRESLIGDLRGYGELLRFHPAISDPDDGEPWDGSVGLIHEIAAKVLAGCAESFEYYMAGPPPMIDAVRRLLVLELKVPVDQLHYDRFY